MGYHHFFRFALASLFHFNYLITIILEQEQKERQMKINLFFNKCAFNIHILYVHRGMAMYKQLPLTIIFKGRVKANNSSRMTWIWSRLSRRGPTCGPLAGCTLSEPETKKVLSLIL